MLAKIFDLLGEDCKGSILEGWLDSINMHFRFLFIEMKFSGIFYKKVLLTVARNLKSEKKGLNYFSQVNIFSTRVPIYWNLPEIYFSSGCLYKQH